MARSQNDECNKLYTSDGTFAEYSGPNMIAANGSANVTISNVAPSGVQTATISQWLVIQQGANGTKYFIPMWT